MYDVLYTKSKDSTKLSTYVAYAPPYHGKSVAPAHILNNVVSEADVPRGLMLSREKGRSGSFADEVAKEVNASARYADGEQ